VKTTDRILLALVLLLGGVLAYQVSVTLPDGIVRVGDNAPDFKIVTEDGKTVSRSDFGGKILVLNFWASWCTTCLEEVPSLDTFQREYGPKGVVVLGVSVDKNEKLYRNFLQQFHVSYATARDPDWDIGANYGTFQLPETYIIDRSGRVVEKIISARNWMDKDFLQSVSHLL